MDLPPPSNTQAQMFALGTLFLILGGGVHLYAIGSAHAAGNPHWLLRPGGTFALKVAVAAALVDGLAIASYLRSLKPQPPPTLAQRRERWRGSFALLVLVLPLYLALHAGRAFLAQILHHAAFLDMGRFEVLGVKWTGFELLEVWVVLVIFYLAYGGPLPRLGGERDR